MATSAIKITGLSNIGANLTPTALLPIVNMVGIPKTEKGNVQSLGNVILAGAGGANFVAAGLANLAYSVVNAAQPNITSVGTLTNLIVTGNARAGNLVALGNSNLGNAATANYFIGNGSLLTSIASAQSLVNGGSNVVVMNNGPITIGVTGVPNVMKVTDTGANIIGTFQATGNANVGNLGTGSIIVARTANLGPIGNVIITGGTAGQVLSTDGTGNLSWTTGGGGAGGATGATGGGGGAGSAGGTGTTGAGLTTSIRGSSETFASGNISSAPNTGNGGQSGIVIVRYPGTETLNIGAGLTGSTVTVGANKVTTFTAGTGNATFS